MGRLISSLGVIVLAACVSFAQEQYGNIRGVVVDKEGHRRIVVGTGGRLLRDAGTAARLELELPPGMRDGVAVMTLERPLGADELVVRGGVALGALAQLAEKQGQHELAATNFHKAMELGQCQ